MISKISLYSTFLVCSFAFVAFGNKPFSPVKVAILTPANISKTIMVIINAINVIPLLAFLMLLNVTFINPSLFLLCFLFSTIIYYFKI